MADQPKSGFFTLQRLALLKAFGIAVSGPATAILVNKLHIAPDDVKMYFDFASALTVFLGGWYGVAQTTPATQITNTAGLKEVAHIAIKDDVNGTVGSVAITDKHPDVRFEKEIKEEAKAEGRAEGKIEAQIEAEAKL